MILLIIFAFIFGALGSRDLYVYFIFKKKNTLISGEVVDLVFYSRSFVPVIKYEYNQQEFKLKPTRLLYDLLTYQIGDKITIFLDPDKPDEFIINSKKTIIYSLLISVSSMLFMIVGAFYA